MSALSPAQAQQIQEHIRNQQLIHAIKLYREATGVSLAEAKQAVEAMARGEKIQPPVARDFDNPVLEGRIKSLLARGQKVEAVRIYREEYRVGLKQAKDAVDRIASSVKRTGGSSMNIPYESAIGGDPFAEGDGTKGRGALLLLAAAALAICGLAVFILLLGS